MQVSLILKSKKQIDKIYEKYFYFDVYLVKDCKKALREYLKYIIINKPKMDGEEYLRIKLEFLKEYVPEWLVLELEPFENGDTTLISELFYEEDSPKDEYFITSLINYEFVAQEDIKIFRSYL